MAILCGVVIVLLLFITWAVSHNRFRGRPDLMVFMLIAVSVNLVFLGGWFRQADTNPRSAPIFILLAKQGILTWTFTIALICAIVVAVIMLFKEDWGYSLTYSLITLAVMFNMLTGAFGFWMPDNIHDPLLPIVRPSAGYVCMKGMQQVGNSCVPLANPAPLPPPDYYICMAGTKKEGNSCVPDG